jgi:hypothetical protein
VKPLPGFPQRHLPDPRVELEQTPPHSVPPGTVRIAGSGWKLHLPLALVLSVGSAVGARLLPTATSTDVAIQRSELAAERERLVSERFREEMRASVRSVNDRLDRLETRISLLEANAVKRPAQ